MDGLKRWGQQKLGQGNLILTPWDPIQNALFHLSSVFSLVKWKKTPTISLLVNDIFVSDRLSSCLSISVFICPNQQWAYHMFIHWFNAGAKLFSNNQFNSLNLKFSPTHLFLTLMEISLVFSLLCTPTLATREEDLFDARNMAGGHWPTPQAHGLWGIFWWKIQSQRMFF